MLNYINTTIDNINNWILSFESNGLSFFFYGLFVPLGIFLLIILTSVILFFSLSLLQFKITQIILSILFGCWFITKITRF